MKKLLVLLALMTPALLFAQCWKSKTLISLGDREISAGDFMAIYEKNNLRNDVIDKKNIDEYLDMYINFKLKVIEAENQQKDTLPKFVKEFQGYRQQLSKPYFSSDAVNEQLVEEAYERMQWDINASHILVKCDSRAVPADTLKAYNKIMELRNRIMKGEDFGDVAEEASEDPSARDIEAIPGKQRAYKGNRGNLGYFSVFDMVYPFETGAYNTKVGEVSMPVRTDFGYHIIKVNSKTPACGLIKVAHIFLAVDDKDPMKSDSVVREKAFNIYKEIDKDGKNWEVKVRKYSDDKGSAQNGGALHALRVSQIVPEFITEVKKMNPNEISEPVKTMYGYHIIRLIGKGGVKSLDEERENIAKRVEKDMRANVSEEVVLRRIKKENRFKESIKAKDRFIATIDSTLKEGQYVMADDVDVDKVLFRFKKKRFTFKKKNYTVGDFVEYIKKNEIAQPFRTSASYAYELYNLYVKESAFAYEDEILDEKYPEFKLMVQEYHDGILLFDMMEQEVWKKAEKDTTGLKNFYEEHVDDPKYQWGERVKAIVEYVHSQENTEKAEELIKMDITADSLKAYMKANDIRGIGVKEQFFQKGDNIDIDSIEWIPGTIAVFPSTVDKSAKVVKVLEVRQPEHKTFKEARGLVTSDYQSQLDNEWIQSLKEKYPVKVSQRRLRKIKKHYQ